MVLPRGTPSDATDVELYGESGCGEEMRLELLAARAHARAPAADQARCHKLVAWR
jgi:hypothetical protein